MQPVAVLDLSAEDYAAIRTRVLPKNARHEDAVFVFARADADGVFSAIDWQPVPPEGFVSQSAYYLELTDEMRASLIKRAHDLQASLIEIHSHPFQEQAEFSPSDCSGFREFVPHVMWRLRGRPYAAVVVAPTSFDSLAWFTNISDPRPLAVRLTGGQLLHPTERSYRSWEVTDERRSV